MTYFYVTIITIRVNSNLAWIRADTSYISQYIHLVIITHHSLHPVCNTEFKFT
jgi:hypothetical protein